MKHFVVATTGSALMLLITCTAAGAADRCPSELIKAKAALKSAQASLDKGSRAQAGAKSQEIQAPRSQEIQAPRTQDIQAPKGQEIQAPRAQDIQAPRAPQDVPVPRGQEIQAPRVAQATTLVQESEAACKTGDLALSSRKAKQALDLLKNSGAH